MKQYPFFPTKTKSVATCSYNQLIPSKPSFGKSFSALLLVRLPVTLLALGGAVAHRLATATPQGDQSPNFGTSATGSPVMKKNHNWHVEHPKILSIGTYWNHWIFKVHRGWSTFQSPKPLAQCSPGGWYGRGPSPLQPAQTGRESRDPGAVSRQRWRRRARSSYCMATNGQCF